MRTRSLALLFAGLALFDSVIAPSIEPGIRDPSHWSFRHFVYTAVHGVQVSWGSAAAPTSATTNFADVSGLLFVKLVLGPPGID
jgi:hypothetical protein